MTKVQLGSEFYVSKSRENLGADANFVTELHGPFVTFGTRETSYDDTQSLMTSQSLSTIYTERASTTSHVRLPEWCYRAFEIEQSRNRAEKTDWSFVTPVWIAIALSCTLFQVVATMALLSIF